MLNHKIIMLSLTQQETIPIEVRISYFILYVIIGSLLSLSVFYLMLFLINRKFPQSSIIDFNIVKYGDSAQLRYLLLTAIPWNIAFFFIAQAIEQIQKTYNPLLALLISAIITYPIWSYIIIYYDDPFYKSFKSLVMLKLFQDGFAKENFSQGYYVSIYPYREDIQSNKDLPIDYGWLVIDENKLAFNGTDYKLEIPKADVKDVFTTKIKYNTSSLFGIKLICVSYQEQDGKITTGKFLSKGGMTAPKIKQSYIKLFELLKNWYNAKP